jgi:hypothetical protein
MVALVDVVMASVSAVVASTGTCSSLGALQWVFAMASAGVHSGLSGCLR